MKTALHAALLALLAGLGANNACVAGTFQAQVQDTHGRPLRDAAVYLVPAAAAKRTVAAPGRAVIEQLDREFIPFVSVVSTGTAVTFPNQDQVLHHVYSFSPAKNFRIKLYEGDPPNPIVFDAPGLVAVGCNIHDWMQAYVLVVDTPHHAVTDDKGRVRIDALPGGAYDAHVWHPQGLAEWKAPVRVGKDMRTALAVTLATVERARKPKPPLDPSRY